MSSPLRTATTRSVRSVRAKFDGFNSYNAPILRDELNIKQLIDILKNGHTTKEDHNEDDRPIKNGNKRSAGDSENGKKRLKTLDAKAVTIEVEAAATEDTMCAPLYSHTFELGYTRAHEGDPAYYPSTQFISDMRLQELRWADEEQELVEALIEKSGGALEPVQWDLGEVTLEENRGNFRLFHGQRPSSDKARYYFACHLLGIPYISLEDGQSGDLLGICSSLQRSGHVSMTASANLIYIPGTLAPELPFQINVTATVSLILPNAFQPYVPHSSANSMVDNKRRLLSFILHPPQRPYIAHKQEDMSIRTFYSILDPAGRVDNEAIMETLQPTELRATLLPFQRRSVKWLLEHESMTINDQGEIIPKEEASDSLPLFWERIKPTGIPDASGKTLVQPSDDDWWYFNRITGNLVTEKPAYTDVAGAMLCEEMGLGKTLECIALILLHPAIGRDPTTTRYNKEMEIHISEVKTNLIVTPATLAQQWVDEIENHAPSLKVLFYAGYQKVKLPKSMETAEEGLIGPKSHRIWCTFLQSYDVVVVTYKVLQDELGIAKAPIIRPKRKAASYSHVEKPRSPLVRVEWARVFMDEVQLVGGGKTAEMVSLIPRKVSIAVSGTPAKSKVSDLSHVLRFLRLDEVLGTKVWARLLTPPYRDLFEELFKKYAIRTLKASIKDELTIPRQRRYAVGIDLGRVEKHIYDEALQQALDDLGVDARGVAVSEGWEMDITLLRGWLRRLRQICTHPQIGHLQRGNVSKPSTIKTMQDVLQDLRDKNWQTLVADRRNRIQLMVRRAQLLEKDEENEGRYQEAKELLLQAQEETHQLIEDIETALEEHEERGRKLKEETVRLRRERAVTHGEVNSDPVGMSENAKGKRRERSPDTSSDDGDLDDDDIPDTRAGDEYRSRKRSLQARIREINVLRHKVTFFLGDVYHVLGETQLEDDAYEQAEVVRKSLLHFTNKAASVSMEALSDNFHNLTDLRLGNLRPNHCGKGGVRTDDILKQANNILDLLSEQGELLWNWRARIFTLLTHKLSNDGDKADGEEYGKSLDTQGEVEAYLQAYAALLADRKEALIAERTALATHEAKEIAERHTMAAQKAQAPNHIDYYDSEDEDAPKPPQDDELEEQLANERKALRSRHETQPLKAMMVKLSEIGNRAGNRSEENYIAKEEGKRLREVITQQTGFMEKLEIELASFRKVFNDRIQYFRQLQELSDTVMDAEWEGYIQEAIDATKAEEDALVTNINLKRAQGRHLENISKEQQEDMEEARECTFCQSTFTVGLITPCAHIFCERCLLQWIKARHNDCPVCRAKFKPSTLQRISFDDNNATVDLKGRKPTQDHLGPDRSIRFNTLPNNVFSAIQTFEAHGSYGSKIMHLIRHLLYLQDKEPGSKSVVFSAWSDSLTIIEHALTANGITSIRVDQRGKQNAAQMFKTNPGIIVFLLHGERENAGLNLTCAKRVWLLEPTVNHAFEVQAIARVDRMGQTAATEVFCYYVKDTVEENILRMGAKHGFSLYKADHAEDMMDISEFSMGNPTAQTKSPTKKGSKQKGDFVESADDLLRVLFPHLDYDEEEFFGQSLNENDKMDVDPSLEREVNAIAGPSNI
ncbi:hypothetical protein M422DRAFT_249098 [Sphaerobolus stellatus SS14]|nr:hypothetical protein M422DRAFT_249098 [Sphaerobolus stellatus SS14]